VQPGSAVPVRSAVCDGSSPDNREYALSYSEPLTSANANQTWQGRQHPDGLP